MRRLGLTSLLAVGLFTIAHAQQPAPAGATERAKAVVVTGCVAGGPGSFTLTNAMAASSTAKPGDSAVGTSGAGTTFELTAATAGIDLKSHVGHKVEISGTPIGTTAGGPGASRVDRSTAGSSGAATDRAADRPSGGAAGAASDRERAGRSAEATERAADRAGAGGVGGAGSAAGGTPSGRAPAQRLNVSALKMLSTTCS